MGRTCLRQTDKQTHLKCGMDDQIQTSKFYDTVETAQLCELSSYKSNISEYK